MSFSRFYRKKDYFVIFFSGEVSPAGREVGAVARDDALPVRDDRVTRTLPFLAGLLGVAHKPKLKSFYIKPFHRRDYSLI